MAAMSHRFSQSAMRSARHDYEQLFSHLAVCRVSLEVAPRFHDICT
jgi:hypothetical protein